MSSAEESYKIRACQICLDGNRKQHITFDDGTEWTHLYEYCIGLPEPTNAPHVLCIRCAAQLKEYAQFKRCCEKSHSLWMNLLNAELKLTSSMEVKEEILDKEFLLSNVEDNIQSDENSTEISYNKTDDIIISIVHRPNDIGVENENIEVEDNIIRADKNYSNLFDVKLPKETKLLKIKTVQKKSNSKKREKLGLNPTKRDHWTTVKLPNSSIFYCGLCDFSSLEEVTVKNHVNEHCTNNEKNCKLCDFVGKDVAQMVYHRYVHQPTEFKHTILCTACNKRFGHVRKLEFHYRSEHLKQKGGLCPHCGKALQTYVSLKKHVLRHRPYNYICDYCGNKYLYRHEIKIHLKSHLNILDYCCEICGRVFTTISNLKGHIKSFHSEFAPVKCSHCKRTYKNQQRLDRHIKFINKEKKFQCDVCSKRYVSYKELDNHMFWHTDARPHVCNVCGGTYRSKGQLVVHARKHTGQRPYECLICEKTFATSSQLKIHQSVHTGIRSVKCLHCDNTFYSRKAMLGHCAAKHKLIEAKIQSGEVDLSTKDDFDLANVSKINTTSSRTRTSN